MIYLNSLVLFFFLTSFSVYIYSYSELLNRFVFSTYYFVVLNISWLNFISGLDTDYSYSFIFFQHYRVYTWVYYYVHMVIFLIGSLFHYLYYTMPLIFHPGVNNTSYFNHYQNSNNNFFTWYSNLQD